MSVQHVGVFVNSKTIAKEYITGKSVQTLHCAKEPKCATKDTQKPVNDTKHLKDANLELMFKAPTNELEKKIEVLETIVVEMVNKLVKLEAELNDIKIVPNKSVPTNKKDSSINRGDQTD